MNQPRRLSVVKLGGSHAMQPHLAAWVAALAGCGGAVVIVPGGGPFADTVRTTQPVIGFDDRAAHHMALLAMEQFGVALASLDERFIGAATLYAIGAALANSRVAVWLPTPMVLADDTLPQAWSMTSDSLAAWLAGHLGAEKLILVKHVVGDDPPALAAMGVVDACFPRHFEACGAAFHVLGPNDHGALAALV